MVAYYNEIDAFAAQWLRNLITAGHIAPGDVDTRDIRNVKPDDVKTYTQCHFFAGIAGWSLALRLAGWPDDRPVWTGSCPCQPFSVAGKQGGTADERHLWPAWFDLIARCKPSVVYGEQVEAAIRQCWLDTVFSDLEGENYTCGAAVLPACSVGAPHIRKRLWFVGRRAEDCHACRGRGYVLPNFGANFFVECPACGGVGHSSIGTFGAYTRKPGSSVKQQEPTGGSDIPSELADTDPARCGAGRTGEAGGGGDPHIRKRLWFVGHTGIPRLEGRRVSGRERSGERFAGATDGNAGWACDWLPCTDGKARPVEPGTFPLAHGVPGRVGRLRAYGNAIVPQVAAEFIAATT